jgi:drug/metabolite transporter superfamily protein YnfA
MQRTLLPFVILAHCFQFAGVFLFLLILYKRPHPVKYFTPLFFYATAYFVTDLVTTISTFYHIRNIPLAYVYYPTEYIFISWLYLSICPRHQKRLIFVLGSIALTVFVIGLFFFRGVSGHNFIGMSFVHSALLIIAGRYLVWLTAKGQTELKYDPLFYVTLGIMLDCGITAISYILFDTFEYRMPYYFNAISDAAASLFVFTGILFLFKNEMAVLKILREAEQESPTT